jgi:hypothetical protein
MIMRKAELSADEARALHVALISSSSRIDFPPVRIGDHFFSVETLLGISKAGQEYQLQSVARAWDLNDIKNWTPQSEENGEGYGIALRITKVSNGGAGAEGDASNGPVSAPTSSA